jgi:hypothetical protein
VDSATWSSVSIWAVRRGAKKLFVVTFSAGGATVAFFGVRAVLPHNIYTFSSYLTGNTIHFRSVARNSDH